MAKPAPLTELVFAAAQLKASAPEAFKNFCDTLRSYELQAIDEWTATDGANQIFRAQGKVKTIQQLRKHIVECYEMRDTFNRRVPNA